MSSRWACRKAVSRGSPKSARVITRDSVPAPHVLRVSVVDAWGPACDRGRHEPPAGRRLPRRRRRCHGDGLHRRADRPRRRHGGAGRPSPRRRRALARGVPVRPAAPGLRLLRRRVDRCSAAVAAAARPRGGAAGAGRRSRRSAPTTTDARPDGRTRAGRVLPQLRVRRRPHGRLAHVRASGSRCPSGAGSSTPATWRPSIPAETPPPFAVGEGVRVVPVNDLARLEEAPSQYVVVGSGKTATDACVWLLARGVDPGAICWVRPRDPWMLNRAVVQPDPAVFLGMAADTMQAAADAASLDDLFLRLEDAGIMLRIDRTVTPTMAKTPTLATWELEQLRTIENVVRRGHIDAVDRGRARLRRRIGRHRRRRRGRALRRRRAEVPAARSRSGAARRSRCSRSGPASRASVRRWSGTSRRPATTTTRRTGSARRRPTATRWRSGPG